MKRSADERRFDGISGVELISTIGLIVYCSVASLGLFLNASFSNPLLFFWLIGFMLLVLTLSYNAYVSPKPLNKFSFIVLGVIALNLLVQVNGGVHSFLWSIYFLYAALIAALSPSRWTYAAVGLILFIETANLIVPKQPEDIHWGAFAGFALSLVCVAAAVAMFRTREQKAREDHERLIARAKSVDPLSDDAKLSMLTQESRKAVNVNAALERESAFEGMVEIIKQTVRAHTYALFLLETDDVDDTLVLRAIRSRNKTGTVAVGNRLAMRSDGVVPQPSIIATCAREKRIYYYPEVNFPSMNLGYYRADVPVRSFLALPIVEGGKTIGVLAVDSLETDAFPRKMQDVLENSAPIFVQIIRNIQISQTLDIKASYFRALHEMSVVLNSSLELEAVLERLATRIHEMAPYDLCVFVRYDEEESEAVVIHVSGGAVAVADGSSVLGSVVSNLKSLVARKGDEEPERRFRIDESGVMTQMLKQTKNGRILSRHDSDLGERGKDLMLFGDALRVRRHIRSLSSWPLLSGDKFIGACILGSARPHAFPELQREVLDTIMNQVAVVMENALLHRQMSERALTDGLTGLLNHRTFMEKLIAELSRLDREPQAFSLLLLDIDHFKRINDAYGHPAGDVALKTVAGIVKNSVRAIDYVARYGGEEFAVGMVGADHKGAGQMAERIRKAVENTTIRAGKDVFSCTLSIGTATLNVGVERKEDLIGRADAALYHAKRSGRNRVSIHERIQAEELGVEAKDRDPATLRNL